MLESDLQRKILRMIKDEFPGAWVRKISDRWHAGIPDILVVVDGEAVFLEVKTENGRVKPIQVYTINEIKRAGGVAEVVRSVEDARKVVRNVARANIG